VERVSTKGHKKTTRIHTGKEIKKIQKRPTKAKTGEQKEGNSKNKCPYKNETKRYGKVNKKKDGKRGTFQKKEICEPPCMGHMGNAKNKEDGSVNPMGGMVEPWLRIFQWATLGGLKEKIKRGKGGVKSGETHSGSKTEKNI